MGDDRTREIYRELVYELLNWRDAQRELKALIKARYRQWRGVLKLTGSKSFPRLSAKTISAQFPGRRAPHARCAFTLSMIMPWRNGKKTLREARRLGKEFWEVR